jgi:hypothetical protein
VTRPSTSAILLATAALARIAGYIAALIVAQGLLGFPLSVVALIVILGLLELTVLRWVDRRAGVPELRARVRARF